MVDHAAALIEKLQRNDAYYDITNYVDSVVKDKEECLEFLDALETEFNNLLKQCVEYGNIDQNLAYGVSKIMVLIGEARRDLSLNVSQKYTMRNLLICIDEILN
jgi:hypothetical protein